MNAKSSVRVAAISSNERWRGRCASKYPQAPRTRSGMSMFTTYDCGRRYVVRFNAGGRPQFCFGAELSGIFHRGCTVIREELTERCVHGSGIMKDLSHVWSKKDDVRAFLITLVELSSHPSRSPGLFGDFQVFVVILIHRVFVQPMLPLAQ